MPSNNFINMIEAKALNKLKNQDIHLGNFLAEAKQTMTLFSDNAIKIANQVRNFRRRYPDDFARAAGLQRPGLPRKLWCNIPNGWLELQYGWKPLMSDIYGAIHHLARTRRKDLDIVEVKAAGKDTAISYTYPLGDDSFAAEVPWEHIQQVFIGLKYQVMNAELAELSSLGLINPLEIVWEVTKYSFVVDWFLPVGTWLSALTADVGLNFLSGYYSVLSQMSVNGGHLTGRPTNAVVSGDVSPPGYSGTYKNFVRKCYTSTPVPGLYFKNPLSGLHIANASALLIQAFSGNPHVRYRG
jgi:hypothetical protein